jgi:hypothetical protein
LTRLLSYAERTWSPEWQLPKDLIERAYFIASQSQLSDLLSDVFNQFTGSGSPRPMWLLYRAVRKQGQFEV